ncbi:hypothetical protein [Chitinivorax sp. B]|uniref:hypothetical protein n=1 Tax=Chitinivorax sp. B TaxID=2502235 RepID=UPI0010F9C6E0|nr:hypothetical protein [Chitinivorax sp. B]
MDNLSNVSAEAEKGNYSGSNLQTVVGLTTDLGTLQTKACDPNKQTFVPATKSSNWIAGNGML